MGVEGSPTPALHKTPDLIAQSYFLRATLKTPASETGMAISIARLCLQHDQSPKSLGKALLDNGDAIGKIASIADSFHRRADKGNPYPMKRTKVREVVGGAFSLAEELAVFTDEELAQFLSEMPQFNSEEVGRYLSDEHRFRLGIYERIRERKREVRS